MTWNRNFLFALVMLAVVSTGIYLSNHTLHVWQAGLIFLTCYPWTINGDVYSLFGGFSKNSIYSLIGIFQVTEEGHAFCGIALLSVQWAHEDAVQFLGFSLFQYSESGGAVQIIGVSMIQISEWHGAGQFIGIILGQSGETSAYQYLGIALCQESERGNAEQFFGIVGAQDAKEFVSQEAGIVIVQSANRAKQTFGVVFAQKTKSPENSWTSIQLLTIHPN